jgi:beta-carotene 15,15'-dioxygenase
VSSEILRVGSVSIQTSFSFSPLVFGFIVVFCLWHALQSLQHQLQQYQDQRGGSAAQFIRSLLPFGLLALAGAGVYFYVWDFDLAEAFILLSLITLPHVLIMHRLYASPGGLNA